MTSLVRVVPLVLLSACPLDAREPACSVALALALDVSASVDTSEYKMQRDGLAAALSDPTVRSAIVSHPEAVALMVYEWSGYRQQTVVVPWDFIRDEQDLSGFIERLSDHQREDAVLPTALGPALGFGAIMLNEVSWCDRLILDVSGDGIHNDRFSPEIAYRHFPFDRVTVNGLVIEGAEPEVVDYYESRVISGPGAFVEIANGYPDYARAMKRKLLRELQQQVLATR